MSETDDALMKILNSIGYEFVHEITPEEAHAAILALHKLEMEKAEGDLKWYAEEHEPEAVRLATEALTKRNEALEARVDEAERLMHVRGGEYDHHQDELLALTKENSDLRLAIEGYVTAHRKMFDHEHGPMFKKLEAALATLKEKERKL